LRARATTSSTKQTRGRQAVATFGSLDVLVNNAGINPAYGPMIDLDLGAARKIFEVNALAGPVLGAAVAPRVDGRARRCNRQRRLDRRAAACAGHRVLRRVQGDAAPPHRRARRRAGAVGTRQRGGAGVVKTAFASALYEGREAEVSATYPLKRLGEPADVAGAVAFLASDDAAWITGHTIVVDGGLTKTGGI
jgi:3-oxoacyl-[acyl-carrier protein] reductase